MAEAEIVNDCALVKVEIVQTEEDDDAPQETGNEDRIKEMLLKFIYMEKNISFKESNQKPASLLNFAQPKSISSRKQHEILASALSLIKKKPVNT